MEAREYQNLKHRIKTSLMGITKVLDHEDVSHDILLSWHQKGRGQTVDQAVIDRVRHELGRPSSPTQWVKSPRQLKSDNRIFEDDRFEDCLPKKGRIRAVLILKFKFGYQNQEVAEMFGISPGRVCQVIQAFVRRYR